MERDIYEAAKRKSVNVTREEAESRKLEYTKRDIRNARRSGYNNGLKVGVRRGFISAAIVAVLICGGFKLGGNVYESLTVDYKNPSYEAGYTAVSAETHRTQDNQGYWYDYYDIASDFDAETMDFDSFVYGSYKNIGWNVDSRLSCMDELFSRFKSCGLTDCGSFLAYCNERGLCEEVDGKLQVNTSAYEKAIKEYIQSLKDSQELEANIESFRQGK